MTPANGVLEQFCRVFEMKFKSDARAVGFYRFQTEMQLLSDLVARKALSDELEHLQLAVGQRFHGRRLRLRMRGGLRCDFLHERGGKKHLSVQNLADGLQDVCARVLFGDVTLCARVNAPEMIEACERLGCESIDGTGWFRDPSRQDKLPALERFIEGHRNKTPMMFQTD